MHGTSKPVGQGSWRRQGLLFAAPGFGLRASHAMLPTPFVVGDVVRTLYASCDQHLRGRIFALDVEATPPFRVVRQGADPVLDLGAAGTFDADGVNPSQIVRDGNDIVLHYIGWERIGAGIPYRLVAGRAISRDNGLSFERRRQMLPLSHTESLFRTAPFVFRHARGLGVLYIGGSEFIESKPEKFLPVYSLRLAWSKDGLVWPAEGQEIIRPDQQKGEIGFGRPVLRLEEDGRFTLLVSRRTTSGYHLLQSPWDPDDPTAVTLTPVLEGYPQPWEAEMTCFGAVCPEGAPDLLFYNGNQFGRTGFGLAIRA